MKKGLVLITCLSLFLLIPGWSNAEKEKSVEEKPVSHSYALLQSTYQPSPGISFGIKLTGGMNYLLIGDPNEDLKGYTNLMDIWANRCGYTMDGEFKELHLGLDFEGDLILYLTPHLGISIGSGYIYGKKGKDENNIFITGPTLTWDTQTHTDKIKVSAIPIRIGIYFFLPVSSQARFFLNGGAGYYFAKISEAYRHEYNGKWFTRDQEATAKDIGFQGGIGFEYDLAQNISFVIEGQGRYAKIGGFVGDQKQKNSGGWSNSWKGTLYYEEYECFEGWFPEIRVWDEEPTEAWLRNAREAEVDFSGVTVRAGIKIKF